MPSSSWTIITTSWCGVVREIKGLGYAAAVQGMKRFAAMEKTDAALQQFVQTLIRRVSHMKT